MKPSKGTEVIHEASGLRDAGGGSRGEDDDSGPHPVASVATWGQYREAIFAQVTLLEAAAVDLLKGSIGEDARTAAEEEARTLGDLLGTCGFPGGSRLARECKEILAGSDEVEPRELLRYTELLVRLRDLLERGEPGEQRMSSRSEEAPTLLVLEADREFSERIVYAAAARGIHALALDRAGEAREKLKGLRPEIVVLDVSSDSSQAKFSILQLLLEVQPPIPTIVVGGGESLFDRISVVRKGARGYLTKPVAPGKVVGEVERVLRGLHLQRGRILVVAEDLDTRETLDGVIRRAGLQVEGLGDPRRALEILGSQNFDLLVLDREMPHLGGIELCRVLRSEPRWQGLPILILSEPDEEIVQRIFGAGADDYVPKPIAALALTTRIANRLERSRLCRNMVDTDVLTGLPDRRRATEMIEHLRRLATRHEKPLALAIVYLGGYAGIADRHGRAVADRVLRELAEVLVGSCRGEDIVGRWSGARLVVGMYGMGAVDGAARIRSTLDRFRLVERNPGTDQSLYTGFSAGIAVYPTDGDNVRSLVNAAEVALEKTPATGGTYVGASSAEAVPREEADLLDVLLVEDDPALSALLTHGLQTHGYRTHALRDGHDALSWLDPGSTSPGARVILMAVDLPGLDGLTLLRRLHGLGVTATSRVILLTARDSESEVLEALRAGAYDHVSKPFSLPVLMERVIRALEA